MTPARTPQGAARREKTLEVAIEGDELRFHGRLYDTYGESDGVTVIHEFVARGRIALPRLEIVEISVEAVTVPYGTCRLTLERVQQVVGMRIVSGFTGEILRRLGGNAGCSHVTVLVLELAAAGILHWFIRIREHLPYTRQNRESGRWGAVGLTLNSGFVNACHGWAEGGTMLDRAEEVLRQQEPTGISLLDGHPGHEGHEA